MHSIAMSDAARNSRGPRLTVARSPIGADHLSTRRPFVRLAQLRKVRECEQVAAVCYRVRTRGIEFLLVRTRGRGRWTFPKGSTEPGLTHAQAAALEAFEEAGVHGRIEAASFARYVRSSGNPSAGKGLAVNAHLCEVVRLSRPKESNRNRTWFSVDEARKSLQDGRTRSERAAFARVIDRALARIGERQDRDGAGDRPQEERVQEDRLKQDRLPEALPKDALQKVQFDFAEAYGRMAGPSLMPYFRRQLSERRQTAVSAAAANRRVLQGQVLEFGARFSGDKKPKALGTGVKDG